MKPKLLLCLALVLIGGLVGCSTNHPNSVPTAVDNSAEGKFFSNREAVCLKSDDSSRPWILKFALTEDTWNEGQIFVTVHERAGADIRHLPLNDESDSTLTIYVKIGEKFKLLRRLESSEYVSYFLEPKIVWIAPKGAGREQLMLITERFYGTGGLTQEHIFTTSSGEEFAPDLKLNEVEFISAAESFKDHLERDESILKGVGNTFTDDGLFFNFEIYKGGDANCCPSGGKVTGTYKLERKPDGKLQIIMDKFKRERVADSDSS
jgi:hypothetical protein